MLSRTKECVANGGTPICAVDRLSLPTSLSVPYSCFATEGRYHTKARHAIC
jgi:hypothetical protein